MCVCEVGYQICMLGRNIILTTQMLGEDLIRLSSLYHIFVFKIILLVIYY